jgi:hypothetical protein
LGTAAVAGSDAAEVAGRLDAGGVVGDDAPLVIRDGVVGTLTCDTVSLIACGVAEEQPDAAMQTNKASIRRDGVFLTLPPD